MSWLRVPSASNALITRFSSSVSAVGFFIGRSATRNSERLTCRRLRDSIDVFRITLRDNYTPELLSWARTLAYPQQKAAGSFDPAASNLQSSFKVGCCPQPCGSQPAFFSGSAARFFSICRFNSSARGERLPAWAFSRNASRPPLWSTLLMALVETRRRMLRPSDSDWNVTLQRFGRNRRLVLMLEWLTLWHTWGPLAVSSQRRDIVENPLPSPLDASPPTGAAGVQMVILFVEHDLFGKPLHTFP